MVEVRQETSLEARLEIGFGAALKSGFGAGFRARNSIRVSESGKSGNGVGGRGDRGDGMDPLIERSHIDRRTENIEVLRDSTSPISPGRDRLAIFIDGSNLFYAALQLQLEIDYIKLLEQLQEGRRLLRAYFYTGFDRGNDKQQGFLLWMRRNGYRVVTKDLIQLPDGSKRANLDVEIAVDMMTLADHCDTLILLSGDGDLAYAVNAISYRGVKVEIVSLRAMTSDALINVADRFTDLAEIQEVIRKRSNSSDDSPPTL
jgi:uncharacterized LabA/DUF88 family protein